MTSLRNRMLEASRELIDELLEHPLFTHVANGTISDETFRRFLTQSYLRVREFERFITLLTSLAPLKLRPRLTKEMLNLQVSLETYEELAGEHNLNLADARMTFGAHASACFLLATVSTRSYEESIAAAFASEYMLLEGWKRAKAAGPVPGRWRQFVDIWTGEIVVRRVQFLEETIDSVAEGASSRVQELMVESFRKSLVYRGGFWDSVLAETDW